MSLRSRIVPTEIPTGATQPLRGLVHDENARWLGGIAGHAGIFSTLDDLLRFARVLLSDGRLDDNRIFSRDVLAAFTRPANLVPDSVRRLGWDGPSGLSSGGSHLSPRSFGHTGFTGTSIWIDPAGPLAVVLLTNAVHPRREAKKHAFFAWRRHLHTAVYEWIGPA